MMLPRRAALLTTVILALHCSGKTSETDEKKPSDDETVTTSGGQPNLSGSGGFIDDGEPVPTVTDFRCADYDPTQNMPQACFREEEWIDVTDTEPTMGMGGAVDCPAPELLLPERPTTVGLCQTLVVELCGPGEGSLLEGNNPQWRCCYPAVKQSTVCN